MKRKIKAFDIFILMCGLVSFWLVISHIAHFHLGDYIDKTKNLPDILYGTNVVSKWADLSFFTYITILIFASWCVSFFIAKLFGLKRIYNFLTKDYIISFVFTNYICTAIIYNIFQIVAGDNFGLYNKTDPIAWHSFATNLLCHYVVFILACIILIKVPSSTTKSKLPYICVTAFLVVYYVVVKICGLYAYRVIWYPYFIFDSTIFGKAFSIKNPTLSTILMILCCITIYLLYMAIYILVKKHKNNQASSLQKNLTKM